MHIESSRTKAREIDLTLLSISLIDAAAASLSAAANHGNGARLSLRNSLEFLQYPASGKHLSSGRPFHLVELDPSRDKTSFNAFLSALPSDCRSGPFFTSAELKCIRSSVAEAEQMVACLFPATSKVFEKYMNCILVIKSEASLGGSVSNLIGVMWLSPRASWTVEDYAENIVHESIHSAIFIHDMVFRIFSMSVQEMTACDRLALSAIRRTQRRFDLAYHSAFVAFSLSRWYFRRGNLVKADEYLDPLLLCLNSLSQQCDLLTAHGKELFTDLVARTLEHLSEIRINTVRPRP